MWAKCDMIQTVGLARCDRVRSGSKDGKRLYKVYKASPGFLKDVRSGLSIYLGIS